MKFHIVHIIPNPRFHGLNGYKEVIDTFVWGLEQLGHEVTYSASRIEPDARNIIFGGQLIPTEDQAALPPDTIFYNLEQIRGWRIDGLREEIQYYARHFHVWDYSEANLGVWGGATKYEVKLVPISFAPVLERIPRAGVQDIDALMYGMPNDKRLAVFNGLCSTSLTAAFLCGFYGPARDELISRSKTIVNATLYDKSKVFEVVRVSYLLANRKAVVSLIDPDAVIEKNLVGAFHASSARSLVRDVHQLVDNESRRMELEERGYEIFRQRSIVDVLEAALG